MVKNMKKKSKSLSKSLRKKTSLLLLTGCIVSASLVHGVNAATIVGSGKVLSPDSEGEYDPTQIGPGIPIETINNDFLDQQIQDPIVKPVEKYSYDQMVADIEQLKARYGDRIQVNVIGTTLDNRNIYDIIVGNASAGKHLMIQAGIHGREYMTPLVAMRQLEYALAFYDTGHFNQMELSSMFNQVAVHFLPMTNPDGISISQFGIDSIRSEELKASIRDCYQWDTEQGRTTASLEQYLTRWKANARGVDLNCNFDSDWASANGKAVRESYAGFKGHQPASEPESQALVAIADQYPWAGDLNYHSMGNILYWDATINNQTEQSRGLAESVSQVTGYPLNNSLGRAGYKDWMQSRTASVPGVTIEMGKVACPLPFSEFDGVWEQNKQVWVQAMDYLIKH